LPWASTFKETDLVLHFRDALKRTRAMTESEGASERMSWKAEFSGRANTSGSVLFQYTLVSLGVAGRDRGPELRLEFQSVGTERAAGRVMSMMTTYRLLRCWLSCVETVFQRSEIHEAKTPHPANYRYTHGPHAVEMADVIAARTSWDRGWGH